MLPVLSHVLFRGASNITSKLAVITVVLFLSACAFDPSTIIRSPRTPEAVDATNNDEAPAGETKQEAKEGDEVPPEIAEAVKKPEQVATVEIDLTNFKERLLGLEGDEINELLGKPKFERDEPPAKIWQFQSNVCFVDLFLFTEDGKLTVDHVEIRGKKVEKVDEKACFASILKAANGGEGKPAPVGPLQPAPGAVKVAPVSKSVEEDSGEEIAPPSLIKEEPEDSGEEPEVPAFGEEDPPSDTPSDQPKEKKALDEDPELPAFGTEDPPAEPAQDPDQDPTNGKGAKEEEIEVPAFGEEDPPATTGGEKAPAKAPKEPAQSEEDEPEVEFQLSPAPGKSPEPKAEPKVVDEPEAEPESEPEPEAEPEPEPEPEKAAPISDVESDRDPLESDGEEKDLADDNKTESDELPNAPKLGTTQTEDDLLEDPAP
ncbi:MAG: hypothetical protein HON14_11445 [Rhodospirillaceae bacterium]|jgi:hypothetical protein|nr:hypothetical protein [Rhodospirillaceae bacterium]MBT7268918.1 hypothetical protein [Rhodospirillaceae bacterium]